MVFMCLLLTVFSTIDQYEEVAGVMVYYLVSAVVSVLVKSYPSVSRTLHTESLSISRNTGVGWLVRN